MFLVIHVGLLAKIKAEKKENKIQLHHYKKQNIRVKPERRNKLETKTDSKDKSKLLYIQSTV